MHCNIIINAAHGLPQRAVEIVLDVVVAAARQLPRDAGPFVALLFLEGEEQLFLAAGPLRLASYLGMQLVEPPKFRQIYL